MLDILERRSGDSVLLTSPTATAWYLDGARTQVALLGPAVLAVEIDADGDVVYVPENEHERLVQEELPPGVAVKVGRWADWLPQKSDSRIVESDVDAELRAARTPLLPAEIERYRRLSQEVAAVMTDVLAESEPSDSELDLAAALAGGVTRIGAEPVVVLVAGSGRLHHRHPLPTTGALGDRAMAVIGARRDGLITNLTRWVRSLPQTSEERDTERALFDVESSFLRASKNGARLGDAFDSGIAAYARAGFAPNEWQQHHQGGVAGYAGRDPRAKSDLDDVILHPTAVAWNPSIPSGKVEDTILLTDEGPEVLTLDERWPTIVYDGLKRPTEMVR